MAAGLAHEINNPAAAIRLHAQLLARALPADSASGQSALTIASESGRIEELVNQWLFLTRPAPPQISSVPLRNLLEESLAAAAPAAEHAGISLTILECPEDADQCHSCLAGGRHRQSGGAFRCRPPVGNCLP
jgi:signal transduction histidine kinase